MKKILLCLVALAPFALPLEGGLVDMVSTIFNRQLLPQPTSVKVLLAHDQPEVTLEVKGKYHLFDPRTGAHIESNYQGKRRKVEATPDGIHWGDVFSGVYQILVVPDNSDDVIVIDGIEYRGNILIYDVGNTISIVNQIELESYLSAVLPQLYPHPLPEELLAAIAIMARTNNYSLSKSEKNPYWDVDADKVGYRGWIVNNRSKPLEKAIRETRAMILKENNATDDRMLTLAWRPTPDGKYENGAIYSKITLEEASQLANQGNSAVQLLEKAFPGTSLQRIVEKS